MMKWFKLQYDNGYVGNDHEEYEQFENYEEAEAYANEAIREWAESNTVGVQGYDWYTGWESEEAEDEYYENLEAYVEEVTPGKCGEMPYPCGEPLEGDCDNCSEAKSSDCDYNCGDCDYCDNDPDDPASEGGDY